MHSIKIAEKVEFYKVLRSVTSFLQHAYYNIKVSVIKLRRLGNKFYPVSARPQVVLRVSSSQKKTLKTLYNNTK